MSTSRRHHYIPEFYLRNFTEPIFHKNLNVYLYNTKKWEMRTPRGIGWFPNLYTMFDDQGEKTDLFEKYLSSIENVLAPIFRKYAIQIPDRITLTEQQIIATFIGIISTRSSFKMDTSFNDYFSKLSTKEINDIDETVKDWCNSIKIPYSQSSIKEYLKPSIFGAILLWSNSLKDRMIKWNWHFIKTTRTLPFITTDAPVLAQKDENIYFISFPISSEVAVIICNGEIRSFQNTEENIRAFNRGTLQNSKEFIICRACPNYSLKA